MLAPIAAGARVAGAERIVYVMTEYQRFPVAIFSLARSHIRSVADLRGKTIGVLDNGKANAGLLMTAVADLLKQQYGAAEVIVRKKPVAGPASPQVIADFKKEAAAVLVGSAD